ncbi:MAG: hypothetical protein KGN84_19155 [Acidobacteriota bacterium]|nr:hypothetical protein [Acidobacteriota bacterium]
MRFENLSGDASLDWVARATADYLARTLAQALDGPMLNSDALARNGLGLGIEPGGAPGSSAQRSDAIAAGATRIVSGTLERSNGGIRISATTEDLVTHKSVNAVAVTESDPMKAMASLAHALSPRAGAYLTSNEEALRLYTESLEQPAAEAVKATGQVVSKDPNFGPAWVRLTALTAGSGDRAGAEGIIAKALAQNIDALDRANLDMLRANFGTDTDAKIRALARVCELTPADTGLLQTLANLESTRGKFAEAARDWKKLASLLPGNIEALNQEGYNLAWAGDLAGSLAAFEEYRKLRPNDPNVLDSIGDTQFLYWKFSDAAASYLAAYAKNAQFQEGGDLYKAAWAQYRAGDKSKADATFAKFQAARGKSSEEVRTLMEGDWLYRTGRQKEAMDRLRKAPASATISAQLAVWDLMAGDRAAAAKELSPVTQISTAVVLVAKFACLPSASAEEWNDRAGKSIHGNGSEGIRDLALGYALILDDRKAAAIPVWERIVNSAPATDFFVRAVLTKLKGERPKFALLPDPNTTNQMRALVE